MVLYIRQSGFCFRGTPLWVYKLIYLREWSRYLWARANHRFPPDLQVLTSNIQCASLCRSRGMWGQTSNVLSASPTQVIPPVVWLWMPVLVVLLMSSKLFSSSSPSLFLFHFILSTFYRYTCWCERQCWLCYYCYVCRASVASLWCIFC